MKTLFPYLLSVICSLHACGQKSQIDQSRPFENLIIAFEHDSLDLFMQVFSSEMTKNANKTDTADALKSLRNGKEKYRAIFPNYKEGDLTYDFDAAESKLIVYYNEIEWRRFKVVKEGEHWKLDEK